MRALEGVKVVELASEHTAFAGRILADLGAEVILVEPPGGHPSRRSGPHSASAADRGRGVSLWDRFYNASKSSVVVDVYSTPDEWAGLVANADVVIEGEPPGALREVAADYEALRTANPALVWASITLQGREATNAPPFTDLTVAAAAGPMWSCGYDDHTLPPVRPGENQAFHTGGIWAAIGILSAFYRAEFTGVGTHVDVSLEAANNVTTEQATYTWLLAGEEVKRQTNRHASTVPTAQTFAVAADGQLVHTGVPPRRPSEFSVVIKWLNDLGIYHEFDDGPLLELAAEADSIDHSQIKTDPLLREMVSAGREAIRFIASKLSGYDFFIEAQQRGLTSGAVYSVTDAVHDPHQRATAPASGPSGLEPTDVALSLAVPAVMSATPWIAPSIAPGSEQGEPQD